MAFTSLPPLEVSYGIPLHNNKSAQLWEYLHTTLGWSEECILIIVKEIILKLGFFFNAVGCRDLNHKMLELCGAR